MNIFPFDLNDLPESLKGILDKIDPALLKKIINMYDTESINQMLDSLLPMLKDSMTQEQLDSLKKLIIDLKDKSF